MNRNLSKSGRLRKQLASGLLITKSIEPMALLSVRNLSCRAANSKSIATTLSSARAGRGCARGAFSEFSTRSSTARCGFSIEGSEIALFRAFQDRITTYSRNSRHRNQGFGEGMTNGNGCCIANGNGQASGKGGS